MSEVNVELCKRIAKKVTRETGIGHMQAILLVQSVWAAAEKRHELTPGLPFTAVLFEVALTAAKTKPPVVSD